MLLPWPSCPSTAMYAPASKLGYRLLRSCLAPRVCSVSLSAQPAIVARARRVWGSAFEVSAEAQAEVQDVDPTSLPKRMVAMHVGYVGTHYRGTHSCAFVLAYVYQNVQALLQCEQCAMHVKHVALHQIRHQRVRTGLQLVHEQEARVEDGMPRPVEYYLERAILRAGLMRKENFGNLRKVKWTRTSRTDKGVHALAAVVALKIHSAVDHWNSDPEGTVHADAVNRCVHFCGATVCTEGSTGQHCSHPACSILNSRSCASWRALHGRSRCDRSPLHVVERGSCARASLTLLSLVK